ncbi:MAG TPA: Xaa-Pro aminopeptidase [Candidatus Saccharimonadales bacterium]|nr:Xaa-Pro aminopeptidase [Candidatus Saccharimonadales bacterium]
MKTFFEPSFFAGNRKRLQELVDTDAPIVITGNGLMQHSGDEPEKFHQDSNFWYLTGLNSPDLTLVMDGAETYLIVPGRSFEREAFDGAHDPVAYAARSGIKDIVDSTAGWQRLRVTLAKHQAAAVLLSPPSYMKRHGLHTLPYRRNLIAKLRRLQPGLQLHDARLALVQMRCVKQPQELKAIQRAVDISVETLNDIATQHLAGATHENELEGLLTYGFRKRGADDHAFAPIVGAGQHSTTLHHFENNGAIRPSDVIIFDIGASVEHYAADVARTVSQQPITGRQAEVFQAVAAAQDFAFSQIKPGVLPIDYEKAVETFVGERLLELGVIKEASRENIRRHFPHATSHFLGLDTHDAGDYRAPWQEHMVLAVEPGIYIPEEGFGVRIEDDVVITKDGCRVLSAACPRVLSPVK